MSIAINKLQETLTEYGLSQKESRVYIATLMLNGTSVHEIAKKANLLRETTYAVLKTLTEKGLVNYSLQSGIKKYNAAHPKKLIELLTDKKTKIESILPTLEKLHQEIIERPIAETYEGSSGMMTATEDMVRTGNKTVQSYVNLKVLHAIPFYHPGFRLRRKERKVFMQAITDKASESKRLIATDKEEYRKTKIKDVLLKDLNCALYIYEDKIVFIKATEKEQYGITIQDKEFAELQRRIHQQMWNGIR